MKRIISTLNAPEPIGSYVQAVMINGFLYTAGQIALTCAGKMKRGINEEVPQVFLNLLAIAEAANMTSEHLTKTTVFLTDLQHGSVVNTYFEKHKLLAARSTVQVSALPNGALVEVEAVFCNL